MTGAQVGDLGVAPAAAASSGVGGAPAAAAAAGAAAGAAAAGNGKLHQQPQPVASSSRNPQLGPNPYFRYPTPTAEQIEEELPPYWETENVPLGPLLDRLTRKAYNDMRVLVETTCVYRIAG